MEMNNDIFTPNLPIPEPVSFEDAPIPMLAAARPHLYFLQFW